MPGGVNRVLLFSTNWPEYMIELANGLSKLCNVALVLPTNHKLTSSHIALISNQVTFFPFEVVFHRSIRDNLKMGLTLRRIIHSFNPDVLHIQANGHKWFAFIYWSLRIKPIIINTIHDPYIHTGDQLSLKNRDNWSKRIAKRFTKRYIVHGKKLKNELVKHYSLKNVSCVDVIPHGHFGIYKRLQNKQAYEEPGTILFFGRLWEYKGLKYFIEAANVLAENGKKYKYVIAGEGEEFEKYRKMISYPDQFEIHNYRIPIENAGLFFQRASIIILPYIDASQSGIIPVAFAYGKPVVVTNVGSLPEVVSNEVDGLIVRSRDTDQLIKAIERLMENEKFRVELGKNAKIKANTLLSWERIAKLTMASYLAAR
ncbi:MAG: glycosyltransferase family 4 protein [Cyclobacteriaceae bacterium]